MKKLIKNISDNKIALLALAVAVANSVAIHKMNKVQDQIIEVLGNLLGMLFGGGQ